MGGKSKEIQGNPFPKVTSTPPLLLMIKKGQWIYFYFVIIERPSQWPTALLYIWKVFSSFLLLLKYSVSSCKWQQMFHPSSFTLVKEINRISSLKLLSNKVGDIAFFVTHSNCNTHFFNGITKYSMSAKSNIFIQLLTFYADCCLLLWFWRFSCQIADC